MQSNTLEIPITDNHIHIDHINGLGPIKVAKAFYNVGGRVMIIPNKPSWTCDCYGDLKKPMDITIDYCNEINSNTDVTAFPVCGVHPAEFSKLFADCDQEDVDKVNQLLAKFKDALNYAQNLVNDGKAIAIGEIGRPHYEISSEEMNYQMELLEYGINLAKDADCPVQIHSETFTITEFEEFAKIADKIGIKQNKLIKHFSPPIVNKKANFGLTPSIIASKSAIKSALSQGTNFLMETDYLDDNSRPGAVLGYKTVPKRTLNFIDNNIMSEEDAFKIHKDNVENIYNIDLDI
ncbi:MAG: TatD family hydrolase [Methanobacteriaceae archaeon]